MVSRHVEGNFDTCQRSVTAGKSLAELMSEGAKVGCSGGMLNQHLIQPLIRRSNGKASDPNDGDGLAAAAFPRPRFSNYLVTPPMQPRTHSASVRTPPLPGGTVKLWVLFTGFWGERPLGDVGAPLLKHG